MKNLNTATNTVPSVSIDEALQLYLAILYPQGIPEDIDQDQLFKILRKKIAEDKPEWSSMDDTKNSSKQESGATTQQSERQESYSNIKAKVTNNAHQENIPSDPNERFFYLRSKEAKENSENRKKEKKEDEVKKQLRDKLIVQKKLGDDTQLKRVFKIRQALESRLQQALKVTNHNVSASQCETLQTEQLSATPLESPSIHLTTAMEADMSYSFSEASTENTENDSVGFTKSDKRGSTDPAVEDTGDDNQGTKRLDQRNDYLQPRTRSNLKQHNTRIDINDKKNDASLNLSENNDFSMSTSKPDTDMNIL